MDRPFTPFSGSFCGDGHIILILATLQTQWLPEEPGAHALLILELGDEARVNRKKGGRTEQTHNSPLILSQSSPSNILLLKDHSLLL